MNENMKVLIVDDNQMSREIAQDFLNSFKFKVDLAPGGKEALG